MPTNKYAEGYPGRRYYGGCEVVDEIEQLAIDRAKALFGAEHANVQPHAGAQANMAVYFAAAPAGRHDPRAPARPRRPPHARAQGQLLRAGSTRSSHYGVSRETNVVDYDEVLALAKEHRPQLIVCGGSAYPRTVDADRVPRDRGRGRRAADVRHGALLRARRRRPAPEPGRALRLRHLDHAQDARRARAPASSSAARSTRRRSTAPSSPGMQGGPLVHAIAAKATCFRIAATEPFRAYQEQVRANADALADDAASTSGLDVLTGGTDTHLLQLDLRRTEWTGKDAEERLHEVKLTVNRNTVPFDERPPTVASGVRIGTPAATMRGFDEDDFREVGRIIAGALADGADLARARRAAPRRSATAAALPGLPRLHRATRLSAVDTASVTHVTHPLVQHKLSYLRDRTTPTVHFRKLVNELTLLLTYEATKDFPTEPVEIETPLERMQAQRISGKKVAVCPVLRAGRGHARGRPLADLERARRLHRPLPRRGDAAAGRVLREAARGPRRARRDRARPDARDRQLERRGDHGGEGRRRPLGDARLPRRGADRDRARARGAPRRPHRLRGDRPRA